MSAARPAVLSAIVLGLCIVCGGCSVVASKHVNCLMTATQRPVNLPARLLPVTSFVSSAATLAKPAAHWLGVPDRGRYLPYTGRRHRMHQPLVHLPVLLVRPAAAANHDDDDDHQRRRLTPPARTHRNFSHRRHAHTAPTTPRPAPEPAPSCCPFPTASESPSHRRSTRSTNVEQQPAQLSPPRRHSHSLAPASSTTRTRQRPLHVVTAG